MIRDREQFDEFAVAVAEQQSRRSLLGHVGGGSLAALLAAAGFALGNDEAEAKKRKCKKKCKKKNSKKAKRKCKKRCKRKNKDKDNDDNDLLQTGSATLTSLSEEGCEAEGECVDEASGELTGTPIAAGTFEGTLTGTNFDISNPEAVTADYTGTLTATETATGDTLIVAVAVQLVLNANTTALTFTGTYDITGGTGRFLGADGDGTLSGSGTRSGPDAPGEIESFTLQGDIDLD